MNDHSIIIDMQFPQGGMFECYAPDDSFCHAVWDCECENIWDYRVIGGSPVHDSTVEGADGLGNEVHTGRFDNTKCSFTEWHDNSDEPVEGVVRVDVDPVFDIDYTSFKATEARIEKNS